MYSLLCWQYDSFCLETVVQNNLNLLFIVESKVFLHCNEFRNVVHSFRITKLNEPQDLGLVSKPALDRVG